MSRKHNGRRLPAMRPNAVLAARMQEMREPSDGTPVETPQRFANLREELGPSYGSTTRMKPKKGK